MKLVLEDRLGHESVHARVNGTAFGALVPVGADASDAGSLDVRLLRQALSDVSDTDEAVHVGHRVVHQDEAVHGSLVALHATLNQVNGLDAVGCDVCSQVELLQQALEGDDIEVVVVSDQNGSTRVGRLAGVR